jgi:hypothetical protein
VAREPLSGTALRGLDDRHQAWVATGGSSARASLVRGEDGQRRVLDILRTLPPELQHSLEVGAVKREPGAGTRVQGWDGLAERLEETAEWYKQAGWP